MFPTHVGMNRLEDDEGGLAPHVPHTRGDEPLLRVGATIILRMFPTHVGMNRPLRPADGVGQHVPHTRGDEPASSPWNSPVTTCSPHTWG